MSTLVLSVAVGFLLYIVRAPLVAALRKRRTYFALAPIALFAILSIALIDEHLLHLGIGVGAVWWEVRGWLDSLIWSNDEGRLARKFLGMILGFGAAYYLIPQRDTSVVNGSIELPRLPAETWEVELGPSSNISTVNPDSNGVASADHNLTLWQLLIVGGTFFVLALLSPHLDGWLYHVSALKALSVELTLGQVDAAHKSVASDLRVGFSERADIVLKQIRIYPASIERDISFIAGTDLQQLSKTRIDRFDRRPHQLNKIDQENLERIQSLSRIKMFFSFFLTPFVNCVIKATEEKQSLQELRPHVRAVADSLRRLLLHLDLSPGFNSMSDVYERIYAEHFNVYSQLSPSEECPAPLEGSEIKGMIYAADLINTSYAYVALGRLMQFSGDPQEAISSLVAAKGLSRKDDNYYRDAWYMPFYEGLPASFSIPFIDEWLGVLDSSENKIRRALDYCTPAGNCDSALVTGLKALLTQSKINKFLAFNFFAYGVAQDKLADVEMARGLWTRAEDYANNLKDADKDLDLPSDLRDGFYDTYALVVGISEAQKASPDLDKLRNTASKLREVIRHLDDGLAHQGVPQVADLVDLKNTRAHLQFINSVIHQ